MIWASVNFWGVYKRELLRNTDKRGYDAIAICTHKSILKGSRNPFKPESVYCLEYAKIYNAKRTLWFYRWTIGGLSYYTQVALFLNTNRINTKRA